jgi:serine/threonine-protein kinase
VKLTDFGIAKRAEQDPTNAGAVRGKFAYISPEQARNEHLDPRSDVFSIGILLWELICNRRLFSGLDDMAALRAVREAQVPRPSEIDPRLPHEIDHLLMTALAKDKHRRHASAAQFGAKLRSLRYGLEVTVGDPATELAKMIESTEEVERQSQNMIVQRPPANLDAFDHAEATVIRIRTADAFSARDNSGSISRAREVINRFEEEEETRLAQLTGDQLRQLRQSSYRESGEMTAPAAPINPRSRRPSDEATRARTPLSDLDELAPVTPPRDMPATQSFDPDEATRMVANPGRRTPAPQRVRPPSAAPPMIPRPRDTAMPGTVHDRNPLGLPGLPAPRPPQPLAPAPMSGGGPLPMPPPGWGPPIARQQPIRDATPTTQDNFERPVLPNRGSQLQVSGFTRLTRWSGLQPWMLVVGALIMAGLAFVITRVLIH